MFKSHVKYTLSYTAVTCWVCFPSNSTYKQLQSKAEAWGSCSPLYLDFYDHGHICVGVGVSVDPVVGVDTGVDIGNNFSIIIGVVIDVPSPNL